MYFLSLLHYVGTKIIFRKVNLKYFFLAQCNHSFSTGRDLSHGSLPNYLINGILCSCGHFSVLMLGIQVE